MTGRGRCATPRPAPVAMGVLAALLSLAACEDGGPRSASGTATAAPGTPSASPVPPRTAVRTSQAGPSTPVPVDGQLAAAIRDARAHPHSILVCARDTAAGVRLAGVVTLEPVDPDRPIVDGDRMCQQAWPDSEWYEIQG